MAGELRNDDGQLVYGLRVGVDGGFEANEDVEGYGSWDANILDEFDPGAIRWHVGCSLLLVDEGHG